MDYPSPSQKVRELVLAGDNLKAQLVYKKETGVKTQHGSGVIKRLKAGEYGPLIADRQPVIVRSKTGGRPKVMRWYKEDAVMMAREGYVEQSHQLEGVSRGCAAILVPKLAYMVVTYRRMDTPSEIAAEAPNLN